MKEINYKYDLVVFTSTNGNQCLKLIIEGIRGTREYYGVKAIEKIKSMGKIAPKEMYHEALRLKKFTDDLFLKNN